MTIDRRVWPLAGLGAVGLLAVAVAARSRATEFGLSTVPTRSPGVPSASATISVSPRGSPPRLPDDAFTNAFSWFTVFYYTFIILTCLGVLVFILINMRYTPMLSRRTLPSSETNPDSVDEEVTRQLNWAVDESLRELDEGESRDAVIAAWLRLEALAAAAGVPREPSETSSELTARVLATQNVTAGTLRRLSEAYREARFSQHAMAEATRAEARAALEEIRRELRGGVLRRGGG